MNEKQKNWLVIMGAVVTIVGFLEVVVPYLKVTFDVSSKLLTTPENQRLLKEQMEVYRAQFMDTIEAITDRQNQIIQDLESRNGSKFFAIGPRADTSGQIVYRDHFGDLYPLAVWNDSIFYYVDRHHRKHRLLFHYYPTR